MSCLNPHFPLKRLDLWIPIGSNNPESIFPVPFPFTFVATGGFSSHGCKAMTHGSPRWPKFDEFPLRQVPFPTFFGVVKKQSNLHGKKTVQARPSNPQEICVFVLNVTLRKFVHLLFRIRSLFFVNSTPSSSFNRQPHQSNFRHTTHDARHTT